MKIIITESQYNLLVEQISKTNSPKQKISNRDKTSVNSNIIPTIIQKIRNYDSEKCYSYVTPKHLDEAKNWWIKWLNDPKTKEKLKIDNKNNKKFNVEVLIKKYLDTLKKIKLKYSYGVSPTEGSLFYVESVNPYEINVSCDNISNLKNTLNPVGLLVHEIQHSLYNLVEPLHSGVDIEHIFGGTNPKINIKNPTIKLKYLKNFGVTDEAINIWEKLWSYKDKEEIKNFFKDPYICDYNEISSRVMSLRQLFNISPGENITIKHILPYLNDPLSDIRDNSHAQVNFILLCWAKNGLRNINDFLNDLNQLVVNNKKIDSNIS